MTRRDAAIAEQVSGEPLTAARVAAALAIIVDAEYRRCAGCVFEGTEGAAALFTLTTDTGQVFMVEVTEMEAQP